MKKTSITLSIAVILTAGTLSARTVALWPLNWNGTSGKPDGSCVMSSENNFGIDGMISFSQDQTGIGWTQPLNLETSRKYRLSTARTDAGFAQPVNGAARIFESAAAGVYVSITNDFTIEGWMRMPELPASGYFFFIASGDGVNTDANSHRWFLTLRNNDPADSGVTWQLFSQRHNTGDAKLKTLDASEIDSLTNGWHHFALSLKQRTSDVVWRFYWDGALTGEKIGEKVSDNVGRPGSLRLGGRGASEIQRIFKGSFSYMRLSDRALEPEDFLNCAGAGHVVALWKLDRDAQGGICGAPSVGTTHLSGGFVSFHSSNLATTNYSSGAFYADSDCAFTGNPPNSTVTLPDGNAGSLLCRQFSEYSRLVVHSIGTELSLTNDFTVEGWLKLECRDFEHARATNHLGHICGTRFYQTGWVFQVGKNRGAHTLCIYAQDSQGAVIPESPLGDISQYDGEWVHLALAYDHDAGNGATGVWTCYVNGEFAGSATNSVAPRDGAVDASAPRLIFGSNPYYAAHTLPAKYDCWRVAKSVLRPAQLMCTDGGTSADNVLAIWPMNVKNGIYIDGSDVVGSYTFEDALDSQYMAISTDGAPEVPGISTAGNGSAGFNFAGGGDRSYLLCSDTGTVGTLAGANGSTFEAYLYREEQPSGEQLEFLLLASKGNAASIAGNNVGDTYFNLTYRANGFFMFAKGLNANADMQFLDGDGEPILIPLDVWTHMALTCRTEDDKCIFDLYINGEKKGTISKPAVALSVPQLMFIGGRYSSKNSWHGKMSTVRISSGALHPGEFLCDKSSATESVAYWPLDWASSALDLAGRIRMEDGSEGGTLNSFAANSSVSGSADRARGSVPRPDTSVAFEGDAERNVGSVVTLQGGCLEAASVGVFADVDDSFTVEGWLNWSRSQGAAEETIAGTCGPKGGWKLVMDSTGAKPMLRIHAEGENPVGVLADGVLTADATSLQGKWHHVALRYDSAVGNGEWSLLVDGRETGRVANSWRPSAPLDRPIFRLGAFEDDMSFVGGYDMWRLSHGVLGSVGLLWDRSQGMILIFR